MASGIIAAIVAFLKALPAFESLVAKFIDQWKAYDAAKQDKEANERKAVKDLAVDAAIDGVLHPKAPSGQQQAPDRPS